MAFISIQIILGEGGDDKCTRLAVAREMSNTISSRFDECQRINRRSGNNVVHTTLGMPLDCANTGHIQR